MKTILKSFSTIGALSILVAGVYVNTSIEKTNDNVVKDINSQEIVIADYKEEPVQIPVIKNIKTDTESINDLKGIKVIPKPEPVKPVVQKPVVKPEPVKEKPVVETKEKPVEKFKKENIKPEPVVKTKPVKPKTDNVKAIDRAKDITKGYCAPELWIKWNPDKGGVSGQAQRSIIYWKDKSNPDIQTITTMINPELDGDIDNSIHTAWHECAHAKTYSIPVDKVDEIVEDINKTFPGLEHNRMELLADAMATVKTGSSEKNYYHKDFTKEQLALAEKIWNLSPEITTEMEYDYDAYKLIDTIR